jgi:hypothetical protein
MKLIVASVLSMALLGTFAVDANAATRKKKIKHYYPYGASARVYGYGTVERQAAYNGIPSYYEHLPDKVPFGSKLWWKIQEERNIGR